MAKKNLHKSASRYAEAFDRKAVKRSLKPGSNILLLRSRKRKKLEIFCQGPFPVLAKMGECDHCIRVERIERLYSAKHAETVKRVRTRVVVVVVVVRELLFLVTSVICMRIRGRGPRLPQLLTTFVQIFV